MNGAGAISAFDNRTSNSTGKGQLGGLLQATTYLSGLSGGSWLVGSLFVQNFTTVDSIVLSTSGFLSTLWQFDNSVLEGMILGHRVVFCEACVLICRQSRTGGFACWTILPRAVSDGTG
ncbi:Lysophospholipase 1 [Metarhizium acridum]|uniref:Lysophospholipase 1 n=1 Tax=Metarhizium acridum TaxID=92637 RepID=UPI001C6BACBD|nr:Lysophospholipase 1 [Metarhizium acridum]